MTALEPRPACRCLERAEALRRSRDALIRGDRQTWQTEMAFVKRTLAEDALAYKDWAIRNLTALTTTTTQQTTGSE